MSLSKSVMATDSVDKIVFFRLFSASLIEFVAAMEVFDGGESLKIKICLSGTLVSALFSFIVPVLRSCQNSWEAHI